MADFKRVWIGGIVKMEDGQRRVDILAERTDGKTVVVHTYIYPENWNRHVEFLIIDLQNALDTLNCVWKDKDPDAD